MMSMARKVILLAILVSATWACQSVFGIENKTNDRVAADKDYSANEVAQRILAGEWVGQAISYSGYRQGQNPQENKHPTEAQILEDLRILQKHFRLIRVYGSDENASRVLRVIRNNKLKLKVMLGIWLAKEPGHEAENSKEVEQGIKLANEFTDVVFAVNVGNEVMIYWTAHPVPEEKVIEYVRRVKKAVPMPVTVADNYAWWVSDGAKIAAEVDFLTVHSYPVWERKPIEEGFSFTMENYEAVKAALPGKVIVLGEVGWPSYTEGNLHVSRTGSEENQKRYYEEMSRWARKNRVTTYFFSAFDEPWKGTGTEGHWGFFNVDRKAKLVVKEMYPELKTDEPTSPSYPPVDPDAGGLGLKAAFRDSLAKRLGSGTVNFHGAGIATEWAGESEAAIEGDKSIKVPFNGKDWGGAYFMFNSFDAGFSGKLGMSLKLPKKHNITRVES